MPLVFNISNILIFKSSCHEVFSEHFIIFLRYDFTTWDSHTYQIWAARIYSAGGLGFGEVATCPPRPWGFRG